MDELTIKEILNHTCPREGLWRGQSTTREEREQQLYVIDLHCEVLVVVTDIHDNILNWEIAPDYEEKKVIERLWYGHR